MDKCAYTACRQRQRHPLLTEIGEEVMIGFIDDNAEKPFFMGAIHTEKNKSADPEKGNDIKTLGTRSGRRIEIDDEKGLFRFTDSPKEEQPKNALAFERSDQKGFSIAEIRKERQRLFGR
jgi:uncharacterized protein involved in type VI secretion and phage assembly